MGEKTLTYFVHQLPAGFRPSPVYPSVSLPPISFSLFFLPPTSFLLHFLSHSFSIFLPPCLSPSLPPSLSLIHTHKKIDPTKQEQSPLSYLDPEDDHVPMSHVKNYGRIKIKNLLIAFPMIEMHCPEHHKSFLQGFVKIVFYSSLHGAPSWSLTTYTPLAQKPFPPGALPSTHCSLWYCKQQMIIMNGTAQFMSTL